MWYRVFGLTEAEMQPADLLEHLNQQGLEVIGHFRGDDQGWFEAELVHDNLSVKLSRFLSGEEGVRGDLNSWAAWVELQESHPQRDRLMQQIISTRQVFTMEAPDDAEPVAALDPLCRAICRYLAEKTGGFYQIDRHGLFTAEGALILGE